MSEKWYCMSETDVITKLRTNRSGGLTHREARKRLAQYGQNRVYPESKASFYHCLKHILIDFTAILLLITAVIAYVFGVDGNALILVLVVLVHMAIVIAILWRSERVFIETERHTLPLTHVVRQGKLFLAEQKQLVRGDIICLSPGDVVPADCRLISADGLITEESNLFGRATGVPKLAEMTYQENANTEPSNMGNMVFASTLVLEGTAFAAVVETGKSCLVNEIGKSRSPSSHDRLPYDRVFQRYGHVLSLSLIAVIFSLVALRLIITRDGSLLFSSFQMALTYAVSTMSEMFATFCTIAVACGMYQTVRHDRDIITGAMIKRPMVIDKLKQLSCLIIPRRGALTTRAYRLEYVCTPKKIFRISDVRYRMAVTRPIQLAVVSTGHYGPETVEDGKSTALMTDEELAIISFARNLNLFNISLDQSYPMMLHLEENGDTCLFQTTLTKQEHEYLAVMRGNPEDIFNRCRWYRDDNKKMLLSSRRLQKLRDTCHNLQRDAYTVIAIATKDTSYALAEYAPLFQSELVFEGLLAFRVPVLKGAGQLIEKCESCGIHVILFDDGSADSQSFASKLGIIHSESEVLTKEQYEDMTPEMRRLDASRYSVFCNLDTMEKHQVVDYLRENGETVGYLGKSLEDLYPMRAADVAFAQNVTLSSSARNSIIPVENTVSPASIAESASRNGCGALKFTADVILSEVDEKGNGGLRSMIDAITASRRIERNLLNILRYLFTSQIARLIVFVFGICTQSPILTIVQFAFIGLVLDFVAVLILSFERADDSMLRKGTKWQKRLTEPGIILRNSCLYALIWAACVTGSYATIRLFGPAVSSGDLTSFTILLWTLCSVLFLFIIKHEHHIFAPSFRINGIQILSLFSITEIFLLFMLFQPVGKRFGVERFPPALLLYMLGGVLFFVIFTIFAKYVITRSEFPARRIQKVKEETVPDEGGTAADEEEAEESEQAEQAEETEESEEKQPEKPQILLQSGDAILPEAMPDATEPAKPDDMKDAYDTLARTATMKSLEDYGFSDVLTDEEEAMLQEIMAVDDETIPDSDRLNADQSITPEPAHTEEDYTEIEYFKDERNSNAELLERFGIHAVVEEEKDREETQQNGEPK